ncbi:MAG: hypothetical protein IPJ61_20435 [Tessaracoccus sp.]|uniref:hypothetical protein n=1 Tax=Tessaracoccus sp. TaxID=1971211 RepID=UPI001ED76CFE|nr:hypothetical protein [Tessaracoccus sp.]MBK7823357.1 hypothetical protein [Tessaracoccus sp.]
MPTLPSVLYPTPGDGYKTGSGLHVEAPAIVLAPEATFAAGVTDGQVWEVGKFRTLVASVECSAKGGSNPTLDVSIMTSPDGLKDWRLAAAFTQRTDIALPKSADGLAGLVMGAVTPAGTTPPTITLTSTAQVDPVNLRIECTTLGARGTAVIRYSIDGGKTWVAGVLTAATIAVIDPAGNDTGVVINYANAVAAVDNVWTASTVGYERKSFTGLDRFVKAVCLVGGTGGPTITATVRGRLH